MARPLAGYEKTISSQQGFKDLHAQGKNKALQDAQKVRLFCPSFVKRRSYLVADSDTEFLRDTLYEGRFTVFARADFFSILHKGSYPSGRAERKTAPSCLIRSSPRIASTETAYLRVQFG